MLSLRRPMLHALCALSLAACTPEPLTLSASATQVKTVAPTERCRGGTSCEQLLHRTGLHDGARVCLETSELEKSCVGTTVCGVLLPGDGWNYVGGY